MVNEAASIDFNRDLQPWSAEHCVLGTVVEESDDMVTIVHEIDNYRKKIVVKTMLPVNHPSVRIFARKDQ